MNINIKKDMQKESDSKKVNINRILIEQNDFSKNLDDSPDELKGLEFEGRLGKRLLGGEIYLKNIDDFMVNTAKGDSFNYIIKEHVGMKNPTTIKEKKV
jgi:hypothetical protein